MANFSGLLAAAEEGLSGNTVRGVAENAPSPESVSGVADATSAHLEQTVRHAAQMIQDGLNMAGKALGQAVDVASNDAFQSAAKVGANIASNNSQAAQDAFSWSGYFQALGILCILLAALWFAVWLIRRYGKFNFLPRPGALPRDALVMEAQLPLGPRKGLMVVRFLNRRLLLGVTEHQISLLTEDKAQNGRQLNNFQDIMDNARNADSASGVDSRPLA